MASGIMTSHWGLLIVLCLMQLVASFAIVFDAGCTRQRMLAVMIILALLYWFAILVDPLRGSKATAALMVMSCFYALNAIDNLILSRVSYEKQVDWEVSSSTEETRTLNKDAKTAVPRWSKTRWALEMPYNFRAIRTPWDISQDRNSTRPRISYSRRRFLVERLSIMYMAYNATWLLTCTPAESAIHSAVSKERSWLLFPKIPITATEILLRIAVVLLWLPPISASHQLAYNALAVTCVALHIHEPADWPPIGASITTAWSMRQFWGVTWHQLLRKFLTANSKFITSILLPHRANRLVTRCTGLFIIFFISGLLHTAMDWARGIPLDESGSPVFFPFHSLIILVEEVAQYLFRPISKYFGHRMKRAIGYLWVFVVLIWTAPIYAYPMIRNQVARGDPVPDLHSLLQGLGGNFQHLRPA